MQFVWGKKYRLDTVYIFLIIFKFTLKYYTGCLREREYIRRVDSVADQENNLGILDKYILCLKITVTDSRNRQCPACSYS